MGDAQTPQQKGQKVLDCLRRNDWVIEGYVGPEKVGPAVDRLIVLFKDSTLEHPLYFG